MTTTWTKTLSTGDTLTLTISYDKMISMSAAHAGKIITGAGIWPLDKPVTIAGKTYAKAIKSLRGGPAYVVSAAECDQIDAAVDALIATAKSAATVDNYRSLLATLNYAETDARTNREDDLERTSISTGTRPADAKRIAAAQAAVTAFAATHPEVVAAYIADCKQSSADAMDRAWSL